MLEVPAPFLFHPDRVAKTLKPLPALGAQLRPRSEGHESVAFAEWRTSRRQIYKPLSNVDGEYGFDALLDRVDHWLARGFGGKALRARDRGSWRAALASSEIADHFEARGFATRGLDETKGQEQTGDIRIERDGLAATVEVYSPVEWEGLDYFTQDAWDSLRQLDMPYTYVFHFDVADLHPMIGATYRPLHPEELTRGLDTPDKRRRVLQSVFNAVVTDLEAGADHIVVEQEDAELNVSLRVELEDVESLAAFEPRPGVWGGPGAGGYRPEVIFRDVIERAMSKARRGQACTGDGLAVFIVDVSRLPLEDELSNEVYQRLFREVLDDCFPSTGHLPVDVFALCRSGGWRCQAHTYYAVWEAERVTRDECEALLGPLA